MAMRCTGTVPLIQAVLCRAKEEFPEQIILSITRTNFAHNLRHWQYLCVMSELEEQFEKLIFKDGLEVLVDLPL